MRISAISRALIPFSHPFAFQLTQLSIAIKQIIKMNADMADV